MSDELELTPPAARRWFQKKRWWILFAVLALFYFTECPSIFVRITPESHYITEPCGKSAREVDYVKAFEKMQEEALQNPEENGYRLILQAFGPAEYGKREAMQNVSWEDFPAKDDDTRFFWLEQWLPVCEKLQIDTKRKPELEELARAGDFCQFIQRHGTGAEGQEVPMNSDDAYDYTEKLRTSLWNPAEHPLAAEWLAAQKPRFDVYRRAVRYPVFTSYYPTKALISTLLPDTQCNREFSQQLAIQINASLFMGEIDPAIDDILTLFRLARHQGKSASFMISRLTGAAIERTANDEIARLLRSGRATDAQLQRLDDELCQLPEFVSNERVIEAEILSFYDAMQTFFRHKGTISLMLEAPSWFWLACDENIARKQIAEHVREYRALALETDLRRRLERIAAFEAHLKAEPPARRLMTVHGRSRIAGTGFAGECLPGTFCFSMMASQGALTDLSRIAIALERFRLKNGAYPASLESLAPEFLPEKPLDPISHEDTLVYKPYEDGTFQLYSLGCNLLDDGGVWDKWKDIVFGDLQP